MPRSYRDFILTAVGIVASAAILSWLLYPERPQLAGEPTRQEQQPGYRAGGPDCLLAEIADLRGRERARRTVTCQEAEEQHRLAANDLVQQRRAADAANASAVLSYEQTRIAAWGVFLGFITMASAIAAAWFARRAAVATEETVKIAQEASAGARDALEIAERNAKAAEDAYAHARDISRQEVRPWVFVENVKLTDGRNTITLALKNYGKTPARNVEATGGVFTVKYPVPHNHVYVRRPTGGIFEIAPGGVFEIESEEFEPPAEGSAVHYSLTVGYDAIGEDRHREGYWFICTPADFARRKVRHMTRRDRTT